MCMWWKEAMSSCSRCGRTPTSNTSLPTSLLGLSCRIESSRAASERAVGGVVRHAHGVKTKLARVYINQHREDI